MKTKKQIVNNVQQLRKKSGFTQEELAARLSVSRQTIISIEKGKYTPSVMLALKIAHVFSTPVESIFQIE
jgi:putative transcriptional regulator